MFFVLYAWDVVCGYGVSTEIGPQGRCAFVLPPQDGAAALGEMGGLHAGDSGQV